MKRVRWGAMANEMSGAEKGEDFPYGGLHWDVVGKRYQSQFVLWEHG